MISTHLNAQMRMEIVVKSDVIYVHLYTLYICCSIRTAVLLRSWSLVTKTC